jgi:diaminopimelate epimerase
VPHVTESIELVKAHAYGNDFLLTSHELPAGTDPAALARAVCDRHRGVGADGLILVERRPHPTGARMSLYNPDGTRPEISGNGVRCIGAWLTVTDNLSPGAELVVDTDAGARPLRVLSREKNRVTFRTGMGQPEDLRLVELPVGSATVSAVVMRVGNPQCVVLGPATADRLHGLAAALAVHPYFPAGTNVELAEVQDPGRVRILIWERGVGPTMSSGTGTCAAAVAAAAHGGASRTVTVDAPGGSQRVEWLDDGLWLTGWAEVVASIGWWGG